MQIQFLPGVSEFEFRCLRCNKVVFDKEKKQLIGTYTKRNMFDTATVVCCGRCGRGIGVLIDDKG